MGEVGGWAESDIEVPQGRLHLYRRGSGPPVVLAHGATDNGRCWSRVAAALEDDFELVAYDARGHGRSTDVAESRSPGADLVDVVLGLGLARPAAMGHSMGAGAVAEAVSARPELFSAAVLEDPAWRDPRRGSAPTGEAAGGERRGEQFKSLTGWVESLQRLSLEEIVARGRDQNPLWHEDELLAWAESKLQYRPGTRRPGPGGTDWRERVRRLRCPLLLVCGTPGRAIVSTEAAAEAARMSPLVEVVRFDAGHNIRREAYEGYVAAVRSFLTRHLS